MDIKPKNLVSMNRWLHKASGTLGGTDDTLVSLGLEDVLPAHANRFPRCSLASFVVSRDSLLRSEASQRFFVSLLAEVCQRDPKGPVDKSAGTEHMESTISLCIFQDLAGQDFRSILVMADSSPKGSLDAAWQSLATGCQNCHPSIAMLRLRCGVPLSMLVDVQPACLCKS